jgi:hypothetical protein
VIHDDSSSFYAFPASRDRLDRASQIANNKVLYVKREFEYATLDPISGRPCWKYLDGDDQGAEWIGLRWEISSDCI